jgi:hypothetical protein
MNDDEYKAMTLLALGFCRSDAQRGSYIDRRRSMELAILKATNTKLICPRCIDDAVLIHMRCPICRQKYSFSIGGIDMDKSDDEEDE